MKRQKADQFGRVRYLTAEEAAKLLAALELGAEKDQESSGPTAAREKKAKWFRIRVTDEERGKQKVSVNLPIGLVDIGLKIGTKFSPELREVGTDQIFEAIDAVKTGAHGKIIDVQENGEHVEVFVE